MKNAKWAWRLESRDKEPCSSSNFFCKTAVVELSVSGAPRRVTSSQRNLTFGNSSEKVVFTEFIASGAFPEIKISVLVVFNVKPMLLPRF